MTAEALGVVLILVGVVGILLVAGVVFERQVASYVSGAILVAIAVLSIVGGFAALRRRKR